MTSSSRCPRTPPSLFVARRRARRERTFRKGPLDVPRSFRVGAPFGNRRFSSDSGAVSLRSKFREPLFDAAKRFRSSNRAENAREAPFSAILAVDRFRTARGRLSRRQGRFFGIFLIPFRFRSTPGAPLGFRNVRVTHTGHQKCSPFFLSAILRFCSPFWLSEALRLSSSQTILRLLASQNAFSHFFSSDARPSVSWPVRFFALLRYSLSAADRP